MNKDFDIEAFWLRLNGLIKNSEYTQATLSEKIGLQPRAISNWISHKTTPDIYSCYLIIKELNTTLEFLITGKETNEFDKLNQLKTDITRLLDQTH